MFCSKCGNEVNKKQKYCDNCGEIISKEEDYKYYLYNGYNYESKGLSIAGFVLGIVSFVITLLLLVWVNSDNLFRENTLIVFGIIGLTSAVLLITGFILSVIGVVKTKDAYGIVGIVLNVSASIIDIITLCTAISVILH